MLSIDRLVLHEKFESSTRKVACAESRKRTNAMTRVRLLGIVRDKLRYQSM